MLTATDGPSSDSPLAILGARGQIGRAILSELAQLKIKAIGLDRSQADLSRPDEVISRLKELRPRIVINAAGYTHVEKAETEAALATQVNGETPGVIAKWCAQQKVTFVHYSSDYVFSGEGRNPWKETDSVRPMNAYGRSKTMGERAIVAAGGSYLIFRTSWVYDATGRNFLSTMLRLFNEKETIEVVDDQFGAPTYAPDIAKATIEILRSKKLLPGIYHMANTGETTWYKLAQMILNTIIKQGMSFKVRNISPVHTSAYPSSVTRPLNSRLNMEKLKTTYGIELRSWDIAYAECLREKFSK